MQTTGAGEKPLILAIDDSADDRFLFSRLLHRAGLTYPIENIPTGPDAMALLNRMAAERRLPLACFLDIKMPIVDGFDVLRWIRARPELGQLPVFMLSSSDQPFDVCRAAQMQAQAFFRKHPSEEELRSVLDQVVTAAQRGQPLDRIESTANLIPVMPAPISLPRRELA